MPGVINLEVAGGLCNRLRALVSGICLSEELKCKLVVHWPSSKEESAAAFSDLYEPGSLPRWVSMEDASIPLRKVKCHTREDARSAVFHNLLIQSNAHFHTTDTKRFSAHIRNLVPVQKIRLGVRRNLHLLPQHFVPVGVHVRRTDNKKSIQESPLSGFVQAMRRMHKGYFYLATDSAAVAAKLEQLFPERVYCHESLRNRNTVDGVQEAMVSLYTLASCSHILGCNGSSFSGHAAEIGMKKVQRIGHP